MNNQNVTDPVCHMTFPQYRAAAEWNFDGTDYFFCCESCKRKFQAHPELYIVDKNADEEENDDNSDSSGDVFTCPMHPEIRQNEPGSCPKCGMDLEPMPGSDPEIGHKEIRRLWRKFILGAVLTALLMGAMWLPCWQNSGHQNYLNYVQWILASLVIFVPGGYLLKRGIESTRNYSFNMFTLITLGILTSYLYSVFALLFPEKLPEAMLDANRHPHLFFESSAMVATLIILGQLLEAKARSGAERAIRALMKLAPPVALKVDEDGDVHEIPLDKVAPGDLLRIMPGASIPVDGVVESGFGHVDESMLTGEAAPVPKNAGSSLSAGTTNGEGSFIMRASKVGKDTLLAQIIEMVSTARNTKAPIQRQVDQVATFFVPLVVEIALVTLLVWGMFLHQWGMGLTSAIAVLLVACPCALGLATPMAILVGSGLGARHGILIKDAGALEVLRKVKFLILDKTGTLTEGRPQVINVLCASGVGEEDLFKVAAALERASEHPLAMAVLARTNELGIAPGEVSAFRNYPGEGVTGIVADAPCILGNQRFLERNNIAIPPMAADGDESAVFVAKSGEFLGEILVNDPIRDGADDAIAELKRRNIEPVLATGDTARAASLVAEELDIEEIRAEMLPQDKYALVKQLQQDETLVAMAGDGINDAAALAAADSAIAMGTGTDAALANAGITLLAGDVRKLIQALRLSDAMRRNVAQNLFLALAYNIVMIPLATGIFQPLCNWHISPVAASIAMSVSSLLVIANALRLGRKKLD